MVSSLTVIEYSTTSKSSDQTALMPRLVLAFAGRIYHIVGNLMLRLNYNPSIGINGIRRLEKEKIWFETFLCMFPILFKENNHLHMHFKQFILKHIVSVTGLLRRIFLHFYSNLIENEVSLCPTKRCCAYMV